MAFTDFIPEWQYLRRPVVQWYRAVRDFCLVHTHTGGVDGSALFDDSGDPTTIQPDDAAADGVAGAPARRDHRHGIVAGAPSTVGTANSEGVATSFARSDHVHAQPSTTDTNARVAVRKNSGADVGARRRLNFIEGSGTTLTVADDAGGEEVDVTIANSAASFATPSIALGTAAGAGVAGTTIRSDATLVAFDGTVPTTIASDAAAATGAAAVAARRDHTHGVVCDTPQPITVGDANSEGSSSGLARGDHKHGFGTAWTNWTPTVTQNGTRTVTVNMAKYCVIGKICFIEANLTITNTGTAGHTLEISNPPQSVLHSDVPAGNFFYSDVSAGTQYVGSMQTHTSVGFYFTIDGTSNQFGIAPSLAVDTNDVLRLSGWYEIA